MTGKYKWEAWNKNQGMSKEDAQQAYVDALLEVSLPQTIACQVLDQPAHRSLTLLLCAGQILKKHGSEGDSAKYIQEIESA